MPDTTAPAVPSTPYGFWPAFVITCLVLVYLMGGFWTGRIPGETATPLILSLAALWCPSPAVALHGVSLSGLRNLLPSRTPTGKPQ